MTHRNDMNGWSGRTDTIDGDLGRRWHHLVQETSAADRPGVALAGFASDAGVWRNHGGPGASEGPSALRRALGNLAWHGGADDRLFDAGDIVCEGDALESAQKDYAALLAGLLRDGHLSSLSVGPVGSEKRLVSICERPAGIVWLYTANGEVWRYERGRNPSALTVERGAPSDCRVVIAEPDGPVWIGTDRAGPAWELCLRSPASDPQFAATPSTHQPSPADPPPQPPPPPVAFVCCFSSPA